MMAMNYGYVYVAQVSMGASHKQFMDAILEAEAYNGPSIIIAYAPCISHGIDMSNSQLEMKRAVESGYWQLFRYNPDLKKEGKNPFILDSTPTGDFRGFLQGENRYKSLLKQAPELAEKLFTECKQQAQEAFETYKRLSELK